MARAQVVTLHRCEVCETRNDVEWKCLVCEEIMCENCKIVHSKSKATREHYIVNVFNEDISSGKKQSDSNCSTHPKEVYQRFCKTCDRLVCLECIAGDHHGHDFIRIQDIIDSKRNQFSKNLEEIKSGKLKDLTEALKKLNGEQLRYTSYIEFLVEEISKRADELKAEIDQVKHDLITTLGQKQTDTSRSFQQRELVLKQELTQLKTAIENSEKKLQERNGIDIIKAAGDSEQALKRLSSATGKAVLPSYPTFRSGDIAKTDITNMFGRLTDDRRQRNAEIMSSFKAPGDVRVITFAKRDRFWLGSNIGNELIAVNGKGKVLQTIDINTDPNGLVVMQLGELIFTNGDSNSIQKWAPDGKIKMCISTETFRPFGLFVTDTGEILVTLRSSIASKVVRFSSTGNVLQTIQHAGDGSCIFKKPWFICQNINGDICITEEDEHHAILLDKWGKIKLKYEGPSKLNKPFRPKGVVCDRNGRILIADWNNDSIHVVSINGEFTELIQCRNQKPFSITIDGEDRMWVTLCENTSWKIACFRHMY